MSIEASVGGAGKTISFDGFARRCSRWLKADRGPVGRRKARDRLAEALRDPAFVDAVVRERTTDRDLR